MRECVIRGCEKREGMAAPVFYVKDVVFGGCVNYRRSVGCLMSLFVGCKGVGVHEGMEGWFINGM